MDINELKEDETSELKMVDYIPEELPAICEECGWEGPLKECGQEEESEGWEYPSYMIATCPKCDNPVEY